MEYKPDCPKCGEKMEFVRSDTTENVEADKTYSRDVFTCKKDDIWVTIETPETEE